MTKTSLWVIYDPYSTKKGQIFPEIRGKKNSANATIRQHLTRAFERGATQHHRVITGLSRVVYYVFQRLEDSNFLSDIYSDIWYIHFIGVKRIEFDEEFVIATS